MDKVGLTIRFGQSSGLVKVKVWSRIRFGHGLGLSQG